MVKEQKLKHKFNLMLIRHYKICLEAQETINESFDGKPKQEQIEEADDCEKELNRLWKKIKNKKHSDVVFGFKLDV